MAKDYQENGFDIVTNTHPKIGTLVCRKQDTRCVCVCACIHACACGFIIVLSVSLDT